MTTTPTQAEGKMPSDGALWKLWKESEHSSPLIPGHGQQIRFARALLAKYANPAPIELSGVDAKDLNERIDWFRELFNECLEILDEKGAIPEELPTLLRAALQSHSAPQDKASPSDAELDAAHARGYRHAHEALYAPLCDAMGYESGPTGMEYSPEEWAAELLRVYRAQPAASVEPVASSVMIDDSGETPAYCVMAAYRNRADAETILAAMNRAAPVAAQAQPVSRLTGWTAEGLERLCEGLDRIGVVGNGDKTAPVAASVLRGVGEQHFAAQAAAEPAQDEREAFEAAWVKVNAPVPMNTRRHDNGQYGDIGIEREWQLWQARAALSTPAGDALINHVADTWPMEKKYSLDQIEIKLRESLTELRAKS